MKHIYRFFVGIFILCMVLSVSFTVSAEIPYESYTYWTDVGSSNKSVYNRPMYYVNKTLSAADIGISEFTKINSICTDDSNRVYILDGSSRIVILDSNFNLIGEIGLIGGTESYNDASSIYVYKDAIYICDTKGKRILQSTLKGELIDCIYLPESSLIPEEFTFNPSGMVIDEYGYMYVLSEGSYYGALLYDPNKNFLGFYGANTVNASLSSVLANIKNRLFPNNEKNANTAQRLPYTFVDIEIDDKGFVYTCNGYTNLSDRKGQIRKLSPGTGSNILGSSAVNFVDEETNTSYKSGIMAKQNLIDIEIDSNDFIYALESVHGKVFIYDSDCNILSVFGTGMGSGTQSGSFVLPTGLTLINDGEKIAVTDCETNLITLFEINDFGKEVKRLISLTKKGDYEETKDGWNKILTLDSNFQPAYAGLARAYLDEGDYKNALNCAKLGYDRDTYSVAFEYQRQMFVDRYFIPLFLGLVLIVVGIIAWLVISTKRKTVLIKNQELRLMLTSPIHPSNNFTDIKEKHLGSVGLAVLLVVLYYVSTVLQTLSGGFLFTLYDPMSFNSLFVLARTVGLVLLWVVSNWLICTLMGGNGKFREIIIVTCYSLIPLIVEKFIRLVLTNVLVPNEAEFLAILDVIAMLYFILMMIVGLLKIHDFSMSRLVGTSVLSILGIAAIVFLVIMLIILLQQFWGFIVTVATELLSL